MKPANPPSTPASAPPLTNEADIGSGEKTPAERETEELIRQIPPLPASGNKPGPGAEPASTGQNPAPAP